MRLRSAQEALVDRFLELRDEIEDQRLGQSVEQVGIEEALDLERRPFELSDDLELTRAIVSAKHPTCQRSESG